MVKKKSAPLRKKKSRVEKTSHRLPKPLKSSEVFNECSLSSLKFSTTDDVGQSHDFIAQDRAVRAINMGLGIRKPGYNIYVAGHVGTGKTSVIKSFLEKWSKKTATPNDWIYVYNFEKPESPIALEMQPGEARKFRKHLDRLIRDLKRNIQTAFQGEDYENSVNTYMSAANERKSKLFGELERYAKTLDFAVKSSRSGIETVPVIEGQPLSEKDYSLLDENQRDDIEVRRNKLEPEVLDFARKVRTIENETSEYIDTLRFDLGNSIVGELVDPFIAEYSTRHCEGVIDYLNRAKEHIVENLDDFFDREEDEEAEPYPYEVRDPLRKYRINVFVDNAQQKGAPVIIESNPTFYNLFGRVEKNVEHGMYQSDFTLIKAGAIQRANGGYLVINVVDIFRTPAIWETLKRVLRNREAFLEDMGEQFSMLPTSGVKPEPIKLDLKVILIGNDEIYHILHEEDEEFHKIFKVKADFDYKMQRNAKNINAYVSFVATRAAKENLLPFHKSSVARIIEFGSRKVEDQELLTTQFGDIKDLTIEADFVAREHGSKVVKREHVEEALNEKFYRLNLFEEHVYDMLRNEDIILSMRGFEIGQINGLTVYDLGDYSFGKTCRITCTTAISDDGIINIERASRLSGRSHDKGMFILSGFLTGVLAKERNLGVSASVCFEQSYGMIDGDSASVAELIAILSAMAEIPIDQSFAVTGSVNQMGEVQPIGGVNEKVEGFYKISQIVAKGKGPFSVMVPHQNVKDLMLHMEVRDAVKSGDLLIYPIKYVWQAFELITGVSLGIKHIHDKVFAPGSALAVIHEKLTRLHAEDERHSHESHEHHFHTKNLKKVAKSRARQLER